MPKSAARAARRCTHVTQAKVRCAVTPVASAREPVWARTLAPSTRQLVLRCALHPSFGTEACACAAQIGDTLEEFLTEATEDSKLRQVLMSLSEAVRTIAFKVSPPNLPNPGQGNVSTAKEAAEGDMGGCAVACWVCLPG